MSISKVSFNLNMPSFKANSKKSETKTDYENPINRNTEKNIAILETAGTSLAIGALAGGASSLIKTDKKVNIVVGAVATLATLALTLPSKLYNTKVGAFVRDKEMNVFSRQKEAQSTIYEDVDKQAKDKDVPLEKKIQDYATVTMADKGQGVMIKQA